MSDAIYSSLVKGVAELGLNLTEAKLDLLYRYIKSLDKWNKAYNLTAIRDPQVMVSHHLLDSLAIIPFLKGTRFADIGTGGGMPGIPLAIVFPEREFVLVDSNGKKTRFLVQLASELGLKNVKVENCRAEQLVDKRGFDMVLSRAFASLQDMVSVTEHLLAEQGCWLAMKGQHPEKEITALGSGVLVEEIHSLNVPDIDAERHAVILQPGQRAG